MEEKQKEFDELIDEFIELSSASIMIKGTQPKQNGMYAYEEFALGDDTIIFGIEEFGYHDGQKAFRVVAFANGELKKALLADAYKSINPTNDMWKECSNGFITDDGKHHVSFSMSHNIPRGFGPEQGVFFEMKNIMSKIKGYCKSYGIQSQLVDTLVQLLDNKKITAPVIKGDETSENISGDSIAKLETSYKGTEKEEEALDEPRKRLTHNEKEAELMKAQATVAECAEDMKAPEDTIGETFAKAIGNKTYKPDKDNEIDMALKDTDVYIIKKDSFLGRMVKAVKGMFGEERDMRRLEKLFEEEFKEEAIEENNPAKEND